MSYCIRLDTYMQPCVRFRSSGRPRPNDLLGHAFKRSYRINLYRAWVRFRLDGVALRGQLCTVPADNVTLPSGARLLAYTISQAKRGAQRQCELASNRSTDVIATLIHAYYSNDPRVCIPKARIDTPATMLIARNRRGPARFRSQPAPTASTVHQNADPMTTPRTTSAASA